MNWSELSRRRARAAPASIAAGPPSPPMASIAMRGPSTIARPYCLGLGRDDFAAVVVSAGGAHVVRELELAAVRAFLKLGRRQRVMAAAHVPLRRRGFSLWDSHCGTPLKSIKIATICAMSQRGRPRGGGRIV